MEVNPVPDSALFIYTETPLRIPGERLGAYRLVSRKENLPNIPSSFLTRCLSVPEKTISDAEIFLLPVRSLIGGIAYAITRRILDKLIQMEFFFSELEETKEMEDENEVLVCNNLSLATDSLLVEDILLKPRKSEQFSKLCETVSKTALPQKEPFSFFKETIRQNTILVSDPFFEYLIIRSLILVPRLTPNRKIEYEEFVPQNTLFVSSLDSSVLDEQLKMELQNSKLVAFGASQNDGFGLCHLTASRRNE